MSLELLGSGDVGVAGVTVTSKWERRDVGLCLNTVPVGTGKAVQVLIW